MLGHLLAGIEVAKRWRGQSYKLLTAIGPSREEKIVQRVFDLVSHKPGIKRRDIMSNLRLSAREMDAAHTTLTQREWVRAVQEGKGTAYYPTQAAASLSLATLERLSGGKNFSDTTQVAGWEGKDGVGHLSDEADPEKIGPSKHSSVASDVSGTPSRERQESPENDDTCSPDLEPQNDVQSGIRIVSTPPAMDDADSNSHDREILEL
jgi:hypothetical protein